MRACLALVREDDPALLVAAVPVGPPDTLSALGEIADTVVAIERPTRFRAVGAHYREFDQVSDEDAIDCLENG